MNNEDEIKKLEKKEDDLITYSDYFNLEEKDYKPQLEKLRLEIEEKKKLKENIKKF